MAGFSLIEAMVTVAVGAILLAVAAPSFSDFVNGSRLATQANDLLAALNLARGEALRVGRRVVFCRSEPPFTSCVGGSGQWEGWLVFVDADGNDQRGGGEAVLRAGPIDAAALTVRASAALVAAGNRVSFRPDGLARTAGATTPLTAALAICKADVRLTDNVRTLFIAAGNRIAIAKSGSTTCAAPPDAQS